MRNTTLTEDWGMEAKLGATELRTHIVIYGCYLLYHNNLV